MPSSFAVSWAPIERERAWYYVSDKHLIRRDWDTGLDYLLIDLGQGLSQNYSWQSDNYTNKPMFAWPNERGAWDSLWLRLEDGLFEYDGTVLVRRTYE